MLIVANTAVKSRREVAVRECVCMEINIWRMRFWETYGRGHGPGGKLSYASIRLNSTPLIFNQQ